jgi:ParB-like chromosome segregation protein Spo0J
LSFRFVLGAVLKVQIVAIGKLKPYWRNPRKRSEDSIRKIAASIKAYGWRQPIVVDREFVVVIGHGRLEAATQLKTKRVPVHVATDLTDEQARALRLADNRVHQESDWDMSTLLAELDELKGLDFDLAMAGFDADDLESLAKEVNTEEIAESAGAPFTGDMESAGESTPAESEPSEDGATADSGSKEDREFSFAEVVTLRQRTVINAAIKRAMTLEKLGKRSDALVSICELYLEEKLEQ